MLDRMIDLHNRDCISRGYKNLLPEVSQGLYFVFLLVKRTLGWKNVTPENFLEINRFYALTSYCNTIDQSNNAFSILGFSLAGERSDPFFVFCFLFFFFETIFQGHTKIALSRVIVTVNPRTCLDLPRYTCCNTRRALRALTSLSV